MWRVWSVSSFVEGTLSKVQEINLYVLSNNKLKYSEYIENVFQVNSVTFLINRRVKSISGPP